MSTASNRESIRYYIEAENKQAVRRYLEESWSPDGAGPNPNLSFTIEEQIADGDLVVTRLRASGTHAREVLRCRPAYEPVAGSLVLIHRFEQARIVEERTFWDAASVPREAPALELPQPALAAL